MSSNALAVVFTPNILRAPENNEATAVTNATIPVAAFIDINNAVHAVDSLIRDVHYIFPLDD